MLLLVVVLLHGFAGYRASVSASASCLCRCVCIRICIRIRGDGWDGMSIGEVRIARGHQHLRNAWTKGGWQHKCGLSASI